MFLQIHWLTSYHATLLNRDDAGLAKRVPFGGAERVRVSSQCLKRHWRTALSERTEVPGAVRSRHYFNRVVKARLVADGVAEDRAHAVVAAVANELLHAAGDKEALDATTLDMKQPVLFGKPETEYIVAIAREAADAEDDKAARKAVEDRVKEEKKSFQAMMRAAGVSDPFAGFEGALFGRFITSDVLARVDAPVHVAHAFTVHALDTEVDYFTVVDDLAEEAETGAAHANDMELGAGIFYGYAAVDIPLLVSNLTGCDRRKWRDHETSSARQILCELVPIVAQTSPGAKLGATAPHAWADCVVLETGRSQPRSLANAFLSPVELGKGDPLETSMEAMARYVDELTGMYGETSDRRWVSATRSWSRSDDPQVPLAAAVDAALSSIFGAIDENSNPST